MEGLNSDSTTVQSRLPVIADLMVAGGVDSNAAVRTVCSRFIPHRTISEVASNIGNGLLLDSYSVTSFHPGKKSPNS
jgi:hypothetical protein